MKVAKRRSLAIGIAFIMVLAALAALPAGATAAVKPNSGPASSSEIDENIVNYASRWCADLNSYAPGSVVVEAPCHFVASYTSQKWAPVDYNDGMNMQNVGNRLCWDLNSYAEGSKVIMAPCHFESGYLSQKWINWQSGDDTLWVVGSGYSNPMCARDVPGEEDLGIIIWPCNSLEYDESWYSE